MGLCAGQEAPSGAAKERESSVIAAVGSGPNRTVEVYDDRVEVLATHTDVVASQNLAKAGGPGRRGWKVMPYGTGVEAEVIAGDPGSALTQRFTITRMVGLGVFALAAPKKKGGSQPTANLAIANEAGQVVGVTFDASTVAEGKMVETALNHALDTYESADEIRRPRFPLSSSAPRVPVPTR